MKIRLKTKCNEISSRILSIIVGVAMLCAAPTIAADGNVLPSTYEDAVTSPALDEGMKAYVRDYQMSRAKSLVKAGFEVEMIREEDISIGDNSLQTVRERKRSDLEKRRKV